MCTLSILIGISDVCKTSSGVPCHFPFTYNGATYDKCTFADSFIQWCATAAEYSSDDYGECSPNCPLEECKYVSFT